MLNNTCIKYLDGNYRFWFIVFCCLLVASCNGQDCNKLPTTFSSYDQAIELVKNSSFLFEDEANASNSSWITGANFYSCDKVTGFLIIKINQREYIHQDVPIRVWLDFKSAESKGKFWNARIKQIYNLKLG